MHLDLEAANELPTPGSIKLSEAESVPQSISGPSLPSLITTLTVTVPDDLAGSFSMHIHHCHPYISPSVSDATLGDSVANPSPYLHGHSPLLLAASNEQQVHEAHKKKKKHANIQSRCMRNPGLLAPESVVGTAVRGPLLGGVGGITQQGRTL